MMITSVVASPAELPGWSRPGHASQAPKALVLIAVSPFRIKFKRKVLKLSTKDEVPPFSSRISAVLDWPRVAL